MRRGEDKERRYDGSGAAHTLALPVPERYLPWPRVRYGRVSAHNTSTDGGGFGTAARYTRGELGLCQHVGRGKGDLVSDGWQI